MRAERAAVCAGAEARRPALEGFLRALAEAKARAERLARGEGEASGPSPLALAGDRPPASREAPLALAAAGGGGEAALRAVAEIALLRRRGEAVLEIGSADGVRYQVAGGPAGLELSAAAPPALLRVARADLHAVAGALDRRGLPVRRATVQGSGRASARGKR